MPRPTGSRVIGMWTRAMLDELAPAWRKALPGPKMEGPGPAPGPGPKMEGPGPAPGPGIELVDPAALRGTDPYIAHEDMVALWSRFTDGHADPLFGLHYAERHAERGVGLYAHAAAHAPDLGTAARACMQLQRLIDTGSHFSMVSIAGGVSIRHVPPDEIGRWPVHLAESLAGGVLHLCRTFADVLIKPREVCFQHEDGGRKPTKWFGCPVRFGQPWNALVFDQATLDLPFQHADTTHFAAIVTAATRTLDAVALPGSFLDEARAALRAQRGKRSSLATLARALKVSERTLQRRLAEAGATFRQLADEVRVEALAEQIAPQKGRATADAIGFADPSSVRRLRKRWRGTRAKTR